MAKNSFNGFICFHFVVQTDTVRAEGSITLIAAPVSMSLSIQNLTNFGNISGEATT
jgi:hypothetical protein